MKISEKQIMLLINHTSCLLSRMCKEGAPMWSIDEIAKLLDDIAKQQSENLQEIGE